MTSVVSCTSGSATYERTRKDDDYGINRKSAISLSFTVAEGTDAGAVEAAASFVADIARKIVHGQLGIDTPAAATSAPTPPAVNKAPKAAAKAPKPAEAPKTDDPLAALGTASPGATPAAPTTPAASTVEDPLAGILGTASVAPPISMETLVHEITTKNKDGSFGPKISALVHSYNGGPPHTVKDIPNEKRAEFIERLKALT